ncbi:MAG: (Fe-S)-binding protein [Desulfobacterota bacterium]|nr:(Fe-S)-binding protein [Thermodesulfobacteriota bacterium]
MITALDVFWVTVAVLILGLGFWLQWAPLRSDRPKDRPADWSGLGPFLLSHRTIRRKPGRGTAHLLAFWGVLVPLTVVILAQFRLVLPLTLANFLSLLLDLLGFLALGGTVYFLQQRLRSGDTGGPRRSLPPLFILAFILLTGFLAEGTRLRLDPPEALWASPVGWLASALVPGSPLFLQLLIRSHFFAVLLLTALLPFTFFRHLAAASLNVVYRNQGPRGALNPARLADSAPGARTVRDLTWKQLLEAEACVSCGRCDAACPASLSGKPLFPRKIMSAIWNQMGRSRFQTPDRVPLLEETISADEIWACTTCLACVEQCPVFVEPVDKILELRRYRVMGRGEIPREAVALIRNLELYGDVYGRGAAHRSDWIFDRELPRSAPGASPIPLLLWTGCAVAFHPRIGEVGRALLEILQAGGQPFGMLGPEEACCGDPVRRLGEESLFLDLARKNLETFRRYQVREIVTLCPHCYHTLKHEYPRVAAEFSEGYGPLPRVFHAAEYVLDLLAERRLEFAYPYEKRIALHDPCYLGRINGVLDPPRKLLRSLPGVRLMELERNGRNGFCCGGGGGRMWLIERQGRRINHLRAEEVIRTGAEVLATACPYCLTMLEDGVQAVSAAPPRVVDLLELVARSLTPPSRGERGSEGP